MRAVASAGEALEALHKGQPDVLVSDIGLPDEDGYELMRKVRVQSPECGGGIPALALTAYATAEDRRKAISAGFQDYLAKPAEPADLASKVAALVGRPGGA